MAASVKLSQKLTGGFLIVAIVTLLVGAAGYYGLNLLMQSTKDLGEENLPGLQSILGTALSPHIS